MEEESIMILKTSSMTENSDKELSKAMLRLSYWKEIANILDKSSMEKLKEEELSSMNNKNIALKEIG